MNKISSAVETIIFIGHCKACDLPVRDEIGDTYSSQARIQCWQCGRETLADRLVAVTSHDVCDASCMSARGNQCVCACGGANHAGAWARTLRQELVRADEIAKFRTKQAKTAERAAKREGDKQQRKIDSFHEWAATRTLLVAGLQRYEGDNWFLNDMRDIVTRYDRLTDNQAAAAARSLNREATFAKRQAEWQAQRAVEQLTAVPAPSGRVEITGEVLSIKWYDGDFGPVAKMMVKCDNFRVFGSVPAALQHDADGYTVSGWEDSLKGKTINFHATVEPKDVGFGTFKRPTKAKFV